MDRGGWARSGKDCYDAILARDVAALGASMNECMRCWEAILPAHGPASDDHGRPAGAAAATTRRRYPGAMYSGCGGGYSRTSVSEEAGARGASVSTVRDCARVRWMKHEGAIVVTGSFDDLRSRHVRFLEEAARLGRVHVLLWSDEAVRSLEGKPPKFPQAERHYLLEAIRYVDRVTLCDRRRRAGRSAAQ